MISLPTNPHKNEGYLMDSIPSILQSIIETHMLTLLYWFSEELYRRLWRQAEGHFLVRLCEQMDWKALEAACAGYHHTSGPGAPPTHTVARLVRALVVKYLFDLSLREWEHELRWNLLVKRFVGYAAFEAGPDHATLERFELWVSEHQSRTYFDQVLLQIDRDFPAERHKPQIADTYALRANAATETVIGLIRHTMQRLLATLQEIDADSLAQIRGQLDQEALFGADAELKEFRLAQAERNQRLQTTVIAAVQGAELIRSWLQTRRGLSESQRQAVKLWLESLDKIITDEVSLTRNEQGQIVGVQELPKKQKGSYRIASATDLEATFRVHGEKIDFGYNVSVAATDTFIREIQADTGSQPDPVAIPDLLKAQQQHHDLLPPKLIYDQAAGTGKHHADVAKASGGQTQLVAPLIPYQERSQRFGPDDFTLSTLGTALTCPHGRVSTTAYRSQSGQGRTFRFSAEQCRSCPLVQQCRGDEVPPDNMRQTFVSDHRSVLAQARTYAQTDAFQQDMKARATIERLIANLVRYHGARYARRRGQRLCDFQVKMNAMAFNIRQWMRALDRRSPAKAAAQT
jgi:hypothetical protein